MRRQTAELWALAMILGAVVVAIVVLFVAGQGKDGPGAGADKDTGGGSTLDPSHYLRRTAVVRDLLNQLAVDARAGMDPTEYDRRLAEATAAAEVWRSSLTPEEKERSSAELVEAALAGLTSFPTTTRPATDPKSRLKAVEGDLRSLDQALAAGR